MINLHKIFTSCS